MLGGTARKDRRCPCNLNTQTIKHVQLHCPLLNEIHGRYGIVNVQHGVMNDDFLIVMEKVHGI